MLYKGSCHCGHIAFEVEANIEQLIDCNCSYCSRKGGLLFFVNREQLKMLTPEKDMARYTFNKHMINHHFCPKCGISPLGFGSDRNGVQKAAINARCLEGVDLTQFRIMHVDGRSL